MSEKSVSKVIYNLIDQFNTSENISSKEQAEKIKVNKVIGAAAYVYEKIRNAVDYNDEHLIRKNAIYRILKRKLVLEKIILENYLLDKYHQDNIAEHLLQELIRGGYVSDIPESIINEVDKIVGHYNKLINEIKELEGRIDGKIFDKILEIEAVEIERKLIPTKKEDALIKAMFSVMNARIQLSTSELSEKEKELQIFIGCHRALYKLDDGMLRHLLLNLYYPEWKSFNLNTLKQIASNAKGIFQEFEKQLNHPWKKELNKIFSKNAIIFGIIKDIIDEKGDEANEIFSNRERLEEEIKKACQRRYKGVGIKLRRGVIRSIIYVFFTKMLLALAIELPLDNLLTGVVDWRTLGINIVFPPILMLIVSMTISLPKKENTNKIIDEIKQITFNSSTTNFFKLKMPRKRGWIMNYSFKIIYALTFVFCLALILRGLYYLNFNVVSSFIFVMFLTLVSFFGMRIRRPVKEIMTIEKRENIISIIIDFISLPFISMGRWLSVKFSRINFIAFLLDFIIEAPFKLLIEIIEDLFSFLKEKKEDVMSE